MKTLICLLALVDSAGALADSYQPSHSCRKPYKPYSFSSQYEVEQYNSEVSRFKRCIQEFVEEQKQAVVNHQNAAAAAIDDWNSFVRYSR